MDTPFNQAYKENLARMTVARAYANQRKEEEKEMSRHTGIEETNGKTRNVTATKVSTASEEMEYLLASISELEFFVNSRLFGDTEADDGGGLKAACERYRSNFELLVELPDDLQRIRSRINNLRERMNDLV